MEQVQRIDSIYGYKAPQYVIRSANDLCAEQCFVYMVW